MKIFLVNHGKKFLKRDCVWIGDELLFTGILSVFAIPTIAIILLCILPMLVEYVELIDDNNSNDV